MVVLGFIVLALAVAAVCVLIGANTGDVDVSALGGTWTVQMYWLVIAGVVLTAAAMLGILLIVLGGARARRQRTRRRELERENRRLASQVGEPTEASSSGSKRPVEGETRHVQPAPEAFPPAPQPATPNYTAPTYSNPPAGPSN
ncbi:MAG: hypothetical protein JWN61_1384 [Pseudonocardiales bacterium]|nr:hypothetical protein [Pseudonocardiales bacterium]